MNVRIFADTASGIRYTDCIRFEEDQTPAAIVTYIDNWVNDHDKRSPENKVIAFGYERC